ncbi:MAG: ABC transporter permease [Chloroflexi bacterium RBG_13_56_8]|nr:MAG: ABC transporter permease [Chloroflexi bacterium RBG_13_56_8]
MDTDKRRETHSQTRPKRRQNHTITWQHAFVPLALVAFIILWELVVSWRHYPAFFLPTPRRVVARFLVALQEGSLQAHTLVTLREVFLGLALGLSVATTLGYALAKSRTLERILSPYIVASQAIPIVALAPLLVVWFRGGSLSKVLVCALTLFFPVLINTMVGIRNVDAELMDLMRSLRASRWQILRLLELPASLPVFFGGLKVGVTLSVIGAVVGEFVGADRGLGFLVNLARGIFDTPLMFVALFTLMFIALALYLMVSALERWLLKWRWPED